MEKNMNYLEEDSLPRVNNYIDNEKFSEEIHKYNLKKQIAIENNKPIPPVSEYIGKCFIQISEGMAQKPNFNRYTYLDEMISDGIENCLRYIANYDIEKETRTGSPNAFYYFSQITYWAFVRRIKKEKKQAEIKENYFINSDDLFFSEHDVDHNASRSNSDVQYYVESSRNKKSIEDYNDI
jgi:hypothetical protein